MYYIKAKVIVRVAGISGPFEEIRSALVHGINTFQAKEKFEFHARSQSAHMMPESMTFEYLEIAGEIR